jgi:hypothetical protein
MLSINATIKTVDGILLLGDFTDRAARGRICLIDIKATSGAQARMQI